LIPIKKDRKEFFRK